MSTSIIVDAKGTINIFHHGKSYLVGQDHINFNKVREALVKKQYDKIPVLASISNYMKSITKGRVEYKHGVVLYNSQPCHHSMVGRILNQAREGFPIDYMLRFLENLYMNPDPSSVVQLYDFLENNGIPITEDGCFLGYKYVNDDFKDKYTGKYDNTPGKWVEMPREECVNNPNNACASGLHVGTFEYVYGNSTIVLVKVNPADCVSVPSCEAQKLRCCKYFVIGQYKEGEAIKEIVVDTNTNGYIPANKVNNTEDYLREADVKVVEKKTKIIKKTLRKIIPLDTRQNHKHQKRDKFGRFV